MLKKVTLAIVSVLTLTACAQTLTTNTAAYRQTSLTPISAGACDNVGRFIVAARQEETLRLEASAEPVH